MNMEQEVRPNGVLDVPPADNLSLIFPVESSQEPSGKPGDVHSDESEFRSTGVRAQEIVVEEEVPEPVIPEYMSEPVDSEVRQEPGSIGVMILVGEGRSETDQRVETLRRLFSDPIFVVQVIPWSNSSVRADPSVRGANENYQVIDALTQAATEWPTMNVILVKDSSVSNASPEIVTRKVLMGNNAQNWDLYYLCKWSDQCQKYVNVALPEEEIRAGGSYLAWTYSPYGFQAILFTPAGRDMILGRQPMRNGAFFPSNQPLGAQLQEEILTGAMTAICTVPNLFDYDISLATKNSDFLKLNECQPVSEETTVSGTSAAALFWFLVIVVLIFIVAWAILRVGPR